MCVGHAGTKLIKQIAQHLASTKSFDNVLRKLQVVSAGGGRCVCKLGVSEEHVNRASTLHGGLTATLVDSVSTLALMTTDRQQPGVSVELSVSYLRAARVGDVVEVESEVVKLGQSLAFLHVYLRHEQTRKLIATGKHTKYVA